MKLNKLSLSLAITLALGSTNDYVMKIQYRLEGYLLIV